MKNVNYRIWSMGMWLFTVKQFNVFFMSEDSHTKLLEEKIGKKNV